MMAKRNEKLTSAIPTGRIIATHMAPVLFESWIAPRGIPTKMLTINRVQLTSKVSGTLSTMFDVENVSTTSYNPQTNGHLERYSRITVTRL